MCGELGPVNPKNWRLYHLLELEQPVTAKQVQWTFRKVTLRHHFYQAYLVLSDTDSKKLYDALGEDALGFLYSGSWGPLICLLGAKASAILYFAVTFMLISALLSFFVFWGLSADGYIMWRWMYIGAPLIFVVAVMMLVTFIAALVTFFRRSAWKDGMHSIERVPAVSNFITASCYAVFTFLILGSLANDGTVFRTNIEAYFYIPIAGDVIYYLGSLVWRWPVSMRLQMEYGLNRPHPFLCYGFFILGIVYIALTTVQWFLIGRKVDEKMNISWYIVYIPLALRGAFRVLEAFMRSMVKHTICIKTVAGVVFDTVGAFFFNGLWVVSLYFVLVHLVRGKEVVPMMFALVPIYGILLYLLCAMFFTLVYLLRHNSRSEREERLNNLKWAPTELQTDEQSGPLLFRNANVDNDATDWDAIDDDWSSVPTKKSGDHDSDYYDDIDSGEEEEIFKNPKSNERSKMPYGGSFPPDIGVRPYSRSHTPSGSEIPKNKAVQQEQQQEEISRHQNSLLMSAPQPAHYDPYNLSKGTLPRVASPDTQTSDYGDEDYEYDDDDISNNLEGADHFYKDEHALVDEISSSASSSAVFTDPVIMSRR